jgi:hypothetical protein
VAIWPERVVQSPDGRIWRVHVDRYRMPEPRPEDEDPSLDRIEREAPLVAPLAQAVRLFVAPIVGATVGRRPWIEASCEDPPTTMVWRTTGRQRAELAIDEIADALARGEERPVPISARWVGYDRGWLKLRRKLS